MEGPKTKTLDKDTRRDTAVDFALAALSVAINFWIGIFEEIRSRPPFDDFDGEPEEFFIQKICADACNEPEDAADKIVDEINANQKKYKLVDVMNAVVAFSMQSLKADKEGRHGSAWAYSVKAQYWAGLLTGLYWTDSAASLATKRHKRHRELSEEAIRYWRENIDPKLSAAKAAEKLIAIIPLSHKKLAELIATERKKQT